MLYRVTYIDEDDNKIYFKDLEGPDNITLTIISEWEREFNEECAWKCKYNTVISWSPIYSEEQ